MRIAPSILAADLADLATALRQCEQGEADLVHVDVMDGHFVPNLTFGPPVVAAIGRHTRLPLDVHLMVSNPERLLDAYLAHAHMVSFHWEAVTHADGTSRRVREAGVRVGVALNPATPIGVLEDLLPELDFVLLMSVNPGFAGQAFLPHVLEKARRLRERIDRAGLAVEIEMDGGVDLDNRAEVQAAGVDIAVVGSGIFAHADPVERIERLRRSAEGVA